MQIKYKPSLKRMSILFSIMFFSYIILAELFQVEYSAVRQFWFWLLYCCLAEFVYLTK